MRQNDFHTRVRVVYRAMCRLYGMERVQDECLKVFKVVYPEQYRAKESQETEISLSDVARDRLKAIFAAWKSEEGSVLERLCAEVCEGVQLCRPKEEFIRFCEDITPVAMRIRKLTPRECGRLQGCDERTIDAMEASGISRSAQYKLYGNSITVDVLFHIFRKLFIETGHDTVKGQPVELGLFD